MKEERIHGIIMIIRERRLGERTNLLFRNNIVADDFKAGENFRL